MKTSFGFLPILFLLTAVSIKEVYSVYQLKPVELPDNLDDVRIFTDEEISNYDGSNPDKPLYMGIKGVVFDVTTGTKFYGKGKAYNALIGKDSTRAVAKMSLEPADIIKDINGLSDSFLKSLDDTFAGTYVSKYPIVGYMDYLIKEEIRRRNQKRDL